MSRDDFESELEGLGEGRDAARRLMKLDLGSQSTVRRSLRARLLSAERPRPRYAGWLLALGAAAALAAWLLLLPRPDSRPQPAAAPLRVFPPPPVQKLVFQSVRPVAGSSPFQAVAAGRPFRDRPIRIEQLFVRPAFAGS